MITRSQLNFCDTSLSTKMYLLCKHLIFNNTASLKHVPWSLTSKNGNKSKNCPLRSFPCSILPYPFFTGLKLTQIVTLLSQWGSEYQALPNNHITTKFLKYSSPHWVSCYSIYLLGSEYQKAHTFFHFSLLGTFRYGDYLVNMGIETQNLNTRRVTYLESDFLNLMIMHWNMSYTVTLNICHPPARAILVSGYNHLLKIFYV